MCVYLSKGHWCLYQYSQSAVITYPIHSAMPSIWRPWKQNLQLCWLKRTRWMILVIYLNHTIQNMHILTTDTYIT